MQGVSCVHIYGIYIEYLLYLSTWPSNKCHLTDRTTLSLFVLCVLVSDSKDYKGLRVC